MNFSMNSDNDFYTVDGEFPVATGLEEIRQITTQELLSVQGDWFVDFDRGLPLYTSILTKTTNQAAVESIYLSYIALLPGIQTIKQFEASFDSLTRTMNISFIAGTQYGALNFTTGGPV